MLNDSTFDAKNGRYTDGFDACHGMGAPRDELGPFPQFAIFVETADGTTRRDTFSPYEAARLMSWISSMMTRQEIARPNDGDPPIGFAFMGSALEILSVRLVRIDSVEHYEAAMRRVIS